MPDEHDPDLETTRQTPVGDDPEIVAGRYRILRTLGRGGGGIVWLARDEHLGREVALKRVSGEADAEVLVTRGLREARTSATLAHDHVVRVYDAFVHEGTPWIVMEYVPGPSLASLLEDGRSLPVEQVARIGGQVATALAAAHSAGVVHRDVKPANVLLTDRSGRTAKLTDFGIARAADDHQLTRTGMVSGTAAYFSPEMARGEDPSAASDVWALGATLYAAVEGRRPFPDAANAVAQLHTIARDEPTAPRQAGALGPVLRGMLEPDPSRRWTAERAAQALMEVADRRRGPGAGPSGTAAAAWGTSEHPPGGAPADATMAVQPVTSTRRVPVPPRSGHGPADGAGTAYRTDRPAPQTTPRRRGGGARRRNLVLGWLIGLPLAALLGWLVWTIATNGDGAPTEDATSVTATEGQPVSAQEAEDTVRAFYSDLQDKGLAAARTHMVDGVPVDGGIADGLDSVDVTDVRTTDLGGGVFEVVSTVTYAYGSNDIVQEETMRVARRGTEALIVQRITRTLSPGSTGDSDGDASGDDDSGNSGNSGSSKGDKGKSGKGKDD